MDLVPQRIPLSLALVLGSVLSLSACRTLAKEKRVQAYAACRKLLLDQQEAWNNGDLQAFVEGYHDSDDTVFSTKKGTKLGRKALLANYKRSYPDRKSMGRLKFSNLKFSYLSSDEVLVRGRWRLDRGGDAPSGSYVLVIRSFADGWKVVLDYSTSD